MENYPQVTIITIVYNGEQHIADTIRSVIAQDYPNLEYIIVDGGSTDNTLGIVKEFGTAVTTIISEKDEGISDAFNKGLRIAKGAIIGMINADDWYEDGAVKKAVSAMEDGNVDVVYGDLRLWRGDAIDFVYTGSHSHLEKEMTVNHPTVFVRKNCYDQFGLFDKQYKCAMDYDLLLRFMVNKCRFRHVPSVLANMRWEGLSDSRWMLGVRETLAIKDHYFPGRKGRNRIYFYKHVLAISLPRLLKRFGLSSLTRIYRANLSRVRKIYE
jgi:glycosyltransferase involved in cell wall biosynthesis